MAYGEIKKGIVVSKSYATDTEWTEIPDDVFVGMIQNKDGSFSNPSKEFDDEILLLRDKRNKLLRICDWTQSRDVNLSNDSEWKTYRQRLRDITNGLSTVAEIESINWPIKPKE
jgi:hypothetical protein